MFGGIGRAGRGGLATSLIFLLLAAQTADAAVTPDQQSAFVAQVKSVVGKSSKGWVARQDIMNQGLLVCAGLVKTGYSPQSIDYQATRLTPAEFPRFPIKRVPARRVVAAAIQYLCPMPPPPPTLMMPEGWVRKAPSSFDGPLYESFEYLAPMTYGMKIPIGNAAQIPAQSSIVTEINCTGKWYEKHSFLIQLVDAAGSVLAEDTSVGANDSLSDCSVTKIMNLNKYPTATHIFIPARVASMQGWMVSGPGVGISISLTGIAPADYCAADAISALYCRVGAGDVYFPPAG